mgnify:CR=1 FL=1
MATRTLRTILFTRTGVITKNENSEDWEEFEYEIDEDEDLIILKFINRFFMR